MNMHDPMSVAFDIPNPFAPRYDWGKSWWNRPALITVWHVDPEKDGTDSSCSNAYRWRKKTLAEEAITEAIWDGETIFDNRPHWDEDGGTKEHKWFQKLKSAWTEHRRRKTFWRINWRWHFWHWSFQIHPLQSLRRRLFSRCEECGKRFSKDEPVISGYWSSPPRRWGEWFRSEQGVLHKDCATARMNRSMSTTTVKS